MRNTRASSPCRDVRCGLDLNRALFLQSQQYRYIENSLDKLKENPGFILAMARKSWLPI